MNRLLKVAKPIRSLRGFADRSTSEITQAPRIAVAGQKPVFDQPTHTGQSWDHKDFRLQRFDISGKLVNPNVAMNLVAERPAQDCGDERVVSCDGGHPALGHPRVFINLDKPGVHACGYCGNRFYNSHVTKGEDLKIEHLNC